MAFKYDSCTRLRVGGFAQYDEAAACAISGLTEAKPRCQWNATTMFDAFVCKVKHNCCETAGLQQ
jgi:hypothetical protein